MNAAQYHRTPIEGVSREPLTDNDLKDIKASRCIHCYRPLGKLDLVTFVRLRNAQLIWWHRQGTC